jgi:hypothetical protein
MERHFLDRVFSDCQEDLEHSVQLLSNLRLEPADPTNDYASELIHKLSAVTTREDGVLMATHAFQSITQCTKQQVGFELGKQNQQLSTQLQILLHDNSLIKRALLKLNAKLQDRQAVEHDNARLHDELQQERMAVYALKVHLQRALRGELRGQDELDVF